MHWFFKHVCFLGNENICQVNRAFLHSHSDCWLSTLYTYKICNKLICLWSIDKWQIMHKKQDRKFSRSSEWITQTILFTQTFLLGCVDVWIKMLCNVECGSWTHYYHGCRCRLIPTNQGKRKWKRQKTPKYVGNFYYYFHIFVFCHLKSCHCHKQHFDLPCVYYLLFIQFLPFVVHFHHKKTQCPLMCSYSWRNPQSNSLILLWRNIGRDEMEGEKYAYRWSFSQTFTIGHNVNGL